MRVLHVDTGREWRGGQIQMLHLLAADRDAHVVLPPDAPLVPMLRDRGIQHSFVTFRGSWGGTRALAAVIGRVHPELVAAHTAHAHSHALLAAWGRPVVVHRRVDFSPGTGPIARLKYRLPAGYIAVSAAVARILSRAGVPPERIDVVHDGVNAESFLAPNGEGIRQELGIPEGAPLVGAVGALVAHKGHRHLIEAMSEVKSAYCVIVGEGDLRNALAAQIARAGLGERVRLCGARKDVPSVLAAIDVFCHPSVEEGMGQAVVEAMIAGVPVVCTNAGGLPEVVEDGVTGLCVPPADSGALARALTGVFADNESARIRANMARLVAIERFGVQRMVDETRRAYEKRLHS